MEGVYVGLQKACNKEKDECVSFDADKVVFSICHGDQWKGDKDRNEHHDRVEYSLRKGSKRPRRNWVCGEHIFKYTVAAKWRSVNDICGKGDIKIGQIHNVCPLFSLRWSPGVEKPKLWMDFISVRKHKTDVWVSLSDVLDVLEDDDELNVMIKVTEIPGTGRIILEAEVSAKCIIHSAKCMIHLTNIDCNGDDCFRFKFGIYRKNICGDECEWGDMKVTYSNLNIDGENIEENLLSGAVFE